MRHRVRGRKLGRNQAHRDALGRNLVQALFKFHRIVTTEAKAKEYRPMAEKLITLGKKGDLAARRRAISILGNADVADKLFKEIAPVFKDRNGGYTRILHLMNETGHRRPKGGQVKRLRLRRLGDNGRSVLLELVQAPKTAAPETPVSEAKAGKKVKGAEAKA